MYKYIFKGKDKTLGDIITYLDENGFAEASMFIANTVISSKNAKKIKHEKKVEKERLEEKDFFVADDEELEKFIEAVYSLIMNQK